MAFETVLVVAEQRAAQEAESTLLRFSYRVLTAANGQQALRILQAKAPVELVLSEVLIPEGMSGISLADRIRVSYPTTAIMLMTPAYHQPIDPSIPLLIKPFAASTLIARVQEVLADARRSAELLTRHSKQAAPGWRNWRQPRVRSRNMCASPASSVRNDSVRGSARPS